MIMDKMLWGKKKARLNKAYNMFFDFCMRCYQRQYTDEEYQVFYKTIQTQFDNLVIQIKSAYEIED